MLDVTVTNAAGVSLALHLDPIVCIHEVKDIIDGEWGMPARCQTLLCGTQILEDGTCIGACCLAQVATLSLTMLVSLRELQDDLEHETDDEEGINVIRSNAYSVLRRLGKRGGNAAISILLTQLCSFDDTARLCAVMAIPYIAESGDQTVLAAVRPCLADASAYVRTEALHALAEVADKGDQETIHAIVGRVSHELDEGVLEVAFQTLAKLAKKGDNVTSVVLTDFLDCPSASVCAAAIDALAVILGSHALSIIMAHGLLERADCVDSRNLKHVCDTAFQALATLCGGKQVHTEVVSRIGHDIVAVRRAAVRALQLADRGDQASIKIACSCLQDSDETVQVAALLVLSVIIEKGDSATISILLDHFPTASLEVRKATLRTLAQVVERGNNPVVHEMISLLQSTDCEVRLLALRALSQIAERGDKSIVHVLVRFLQQKSEAYKVRRGRNQSEGDEIEEAAKTMGELVCAGDKQAVAALESSLSFLAPHRKKIIKTVLDMIS